MVTQQRNFIITLIILGLSLFSSFSCGDIKNYLDFLYSSEGDEAEPVYSFKCLPERFSLNMPTILLDDTFFGPKPRSSKTNEECLSGYSYPAVETMVNEIERNKNDLKFELLTLDLILNNEGMVDRLEDEKKIYTRSGLFEIIVTEGISLKVDEIYQDDYILFSRSVEIGESLPIPTMCLVLPLEEEYNYAIYYSFADEESNLPESCDDLELFSTVVKWNKERTKIYIKDKRAKLEESSSNKEYIFDLNTNEMSFAYDYSFFEEQYYNNVVNIKTCSLTNNQNDCILINGNNLFDGVEVGVKWNDEKQSFDFTKTDVYRQYEFTGKVDSTGGLLRSIYNSQRDSEEENEKYIEEIGKKTCVTSTGIYDDELNNWKWQGKESNQSSSYWFENEVE